MGRLGRLPLVVVVALGAVWTAACAAADDYPSRPVTLVVPWGAGGGADAIGRVIGRLMSPALGQPISVVNRTGGNGVIGHQAIAGAEADGYTVGMITTEVTMLHHQGLTNLTPSSFTPIGLISVDPVGIHVRDDAPWMSLSELLAAIRREPGRYKASGGSQGGLWHVAFYGMLDEQRIAPTTVSWTPSNGSAAALLELVAGRVDIVASSYPEARSLIDAHRVRTLAILGETRSALYPDVPTARESGATAWQMGVWRGLAGPSGLPAGVQRRLASALEAAYRSAEFGEFMASRRFGRQWVPATEFADFMADTDAQVPAILRRIGLAQRPPG